MFNLSPFAESFNNYAKDIQYKLGYHDGTTGENITSRNQDYIRGYLAACEHRLNSIKNNDQTSIQ